MKFRVLFFSTLQDVIGAEALEVELPNRNSCHVSDLLDYLYGEYPGLRAWDKSLLIAADLEYVKRETPLKSGQEIAVMPPVQGG